LQSFNKDKPVKRPENSLSLNVRGPSLLKRVSFGKFNSVRVRAVISRFLIPPTKIL
jgi:hypothetical protein